MNCIDKDKTLHTLLTVIHSYECQYIRKYEGSDCSPVSMMCTLYGHAFSLSVAPHAQNLLSLLVVEACGGQAGSIFHIVFHLFPVVPSAVYPFPVPIG